MNSPLRVGLVVDNLSLPAWQILLLERLRQVGGVRLSLFVVLHPLVFPGEGSLYRALFGRATSGDAFARQDISARLAGLPRLEAASARIEGDVLEEIRRASLDVLLQLGGEPLSGAALGAARWGVWSYLPSGSGLESSAPGTAELLAGQPACILRLVARLADDQPPRLLYQSTSAANPRSLTSTRGRMYWKGAAFVARLLGQAAAGRDPLAGAPVMESLPAEHLPTNAEVLHIGASLAGSWLSYWVNKLSGHTHWRLIYRYEDHPRFTCAGSQPLAPPRDRFWSDPFPIQRGGRTFIFIEEFVYRLKRGRIAVLELDANGIAGQPRPVLELPYHLSYPFLFEWQGELYMLPEAATSRQLTAYRCVEFPLRWEPAVTLLDGVSVLDATLLEHAGRWWLFASQREHPGATTWDELFLYSADNPLSRTWQPHPLNPVVSNVERARPAGRIFCEQGQLYRPAQNSAGSYGAGLVMHVIERLEPDAYQERVVASILPEPGRTGVHTFNRAGRLTVLDSKGRVRRWS
jgi:hypothetical protein